jgi:16S rRNA (guanine527-N7)-methyltransferase
MEADTASRVGLVAEIKCLWDRSDYPISEFQLGQLALYLELLNKWNRVHSLTAIEHPSEQVRRHILEGLALWPEIVARFDGRGATRLADVGSGMGVPGLVLAVVMPATQIDLIERNQKKAAFLRQASGRLGLTKNVRVVEADVSAIRPNPEYDLITSRAFAALPVFLELTAGISGPKTRWAAMLGKQPISERILLNKSNLIKELIIEETIKMKISGVQEERHLAWIGSPL